MVCDITEGAMYFSLKKQISVLKNENCSVLVISLTYLIEKSCLNKIKWYDHTDKYSYWRLTNCRESPSVPRQYIEIAHISSHIV